ncbi:MAG: peptidase [Alphaproteobacteria bacterium]|nr:MAG: peptidase [Alphaproteobacteria bacterium]
MPQKNRLSDSGRYGGWRKQSPDQRDFRYAPPNHVMAALPPAVDLTSGMGQVLDQSSLGSCGAHAVDSLIMFDQQKQGMPVTSSSRLLIYYFTRVIMGTVNEDSGVDNRTLLQALNKYGFCDESLWPYDISKFTQRPPDAAIQAASGSLVQNYASVRQDLATMKGTIASGFPFLYGFTVYASFESDQVARTGIVPMPGRSEQVYGGHDVVICGYDDHTQRFKFKNSWNGWGENNSGYGYFPYAFATNPDLASDFWVINAIPSVTPVPPPPPPPPPPSPRRVFGLSFARPIPKGRRITFASPVDVPAGDYDVFPAGTRQTIADVETEE